MSRHENGWITRGFSVAEAEYILEPLREGAEFTLHRGRERGDPRPILAVAVAAEQPSPHSVRRLEHEYSLASELDSAWSARPLALVRQQGRAVLILADPGGEPLDRIIEQENGRAIDLNRFLRIAMGLAAALNCAHRQGLIHKDIKPGNALVEASGQVWLTGFGIASRLPREHLTLASPEIIAGTLAYMSPEQTGRMNRSIDSRSDLYSLGVTLYEMLTGVLPFTAADPLEWVHCHIARQPVAPIDRRAVPKVLSALIMKLLAKNPEERFQTAAGLEADLRRCHSEWQSHGRIDRFSLGAEDLSDRLLMAEKLYGREREVDALLAAFDRVVAQGTAELVLVSGYSGVGKSSVVNELHKALVPPRGLFAAGKFDQYKRDIPYATLAQAFQMLVHQILVKNEAEVDHWRRALLEALGANGQLIINLVPEVEFVIGNQPPVTELPPREARNRFQLVLRRFLGVFAKREHPLALFLDDLQWMDAATLELLEYLITDPDIRHFMLVGAYRDNEVNPLHPLMRTLTAIRDAGTRLQEVVLAPLGPEDIGQLVADSLRCERETAGLLAQLVHEKTGGNPFFTFQFITELEQEGLLRFEPNAATWRWDLKRIHSKGYTTNVVDLMVGKLSRFPNATQESLKQLACLGNSAEFGLLRTVFGDSGEEEIHSQLWEAVRAGLIFRSENSYSFVHDRIQEAAYFLIPEQQRAQTHLRIGRILIESTPQQQLEESIFDIVSQLNRGSRLITEAGEREAAANLNLIAGRRAKASTAYTSALKYLHTGRSLLSEETWTINYELIFSIESLTAECELHTADMVAAEARLSMLAQHARGRHDFAVVTRLQVTLYTTLDRSERAIEAFLEYLRRNGTDWSPHPAHDDVMQEHNRIWSLLGSRHIEDLLDLPLLDDPDVLDMLDVFTEIVHPAMFFDENLSTLVVCRMVSLCLEHGNCDASCFGYVWFGMFAGPRFNNYKDGFRFGQLGYDLVEKRNLTRYQARTYISFGTLTPWAKHALKGRELVRRAFDVAYRTGDLTFSAYSWHELITNYLAVGDPLAEVQSEAEKGLNFVKKSGFGLVAENCAAQLGLIRTLRGLTSTFGSFDAPDYNEADTEHRLVSNPVLALAEFFYWTRKLQARFFAGDYASAVEASRKAHQLLWPAASQVETGDFRFYAALAHAAAWNSASSEEKQKHFAAIDDHHRQLETWTLHCPANFEARAALITAEIARIEGRIPDAEHFYEVAIRSAQENGFVHCEAVANECAAQFYSARGFTKIANVYLRDARKCYLRWGADAKVRQLEERYPKIKAEPSSFGTGTIRASVEQLDLATVIRVLEAVSGEIEHEKLINTLMHTAIEHAGAERGLLILVRDGEPRIEAEATIGSGNVEVSVRQERVTQSDLPQSALNYVVRTQESVLLDDASSDAVYSSDEYVRQKRSRSVLCLPIVKQKKLVGVLYLENNLAACVFTSNRVAVLRLLASQAAISLENAALYTDLQLQVGLLQHLPVSAWTLKPDGTADFVNQVWLEFAGQTPDFVRSHPEAWMSAVHPDDREIATKSFWEGVHSEQDFAFETRSLRARDGTYRWHLNQAVVLRDSEGRVLKFVGTTTDIDDQKRTQEVLRKSESTLQRVIDTIPTLTWSMLPDGSNEFLSSQWHDYTGFSSEMSRGWGWQAAFHPEDLPILTERWRTLLASGEPGAVEARLRDRHGVYRWFLIRVAPFCDEKGTIVRWYGTSTEINARKLAEEALRMRELNLIEITETIPEMLWSASPDGAIEYCNGRFLDYTGLSLEQTLNDGWINVLHPDDVQPTIKVWNSCVKTGSPYRVEVRTFHVPDHTYRWCVTSALPLRDQQGHIVKWHGTVVDMHDWKQAQEELRHTQAELARMMRVMTISQLTASIAHEVNQPLSGIITNASTCLRMLKSDPPNIDGAQETARRAIRDGNRASEIITRLRTLFSKKQSELEPLDLNEAAREVITLLSGELQKNNVILKHEFSDHLSVVKGDRVQIQQVILNLIRNGSDAMSGIEDRPRQMVVRTELEGDHVRLSVQDSGIGFAQEIADHIFNPFYTTKPDGMGIGLSISRSIIESHGGRLWAEDAVTGSGAIFQFNLPAMISGSNKSDRQIARGSTGHSI
ncbi:MAG: PAS domain-containing protein [Terriglobales bacterium]